MFYLVMVSRSGEEEILSGYTEIKSGVEAAQIAKRLSLESGRKIQPRPARSGVDWRPMVRALFESGDYTALPAEIDLKPIADHFAHIHLDEKNNRTLIGYFPSDFDGERMTPRPVTVGRYLMKYYPDLGNDERRRIIALLDPAGALKFARTENEIDHVYKEGPTSCMKGFRSEMRGHGLTQHPVRAFAAGDLELAYLQREDRGITARGLCWPARKVYGRLYGDTERLSEALHKEGFGPTRFFDGARIKKVFVKNPERQILMVPFLDNATWLEIREDCLVMRDEDWDPVSEGILTRSPSSRTSHGVAYIERYCRKIESWGRACDFMAVQTSEGEEQWSRDAVIHYSFTDRRTGRRMDKALGVRMSKADEDYWSKEDFAANGFTCAVTGRRYPNRHGVQNEKGEWVRRDIEPSASATTPTSGNSFSAGSYVVVPGTTFGLMSAGAAFIDNSFTASGPTIRPSSSRIAAPDRTQQEAQELLERLRADENRRQRRRREQNDRLMREIERNAQPVNQNGE